MKHFILTLLLLISCTAVLLARVQEEVYPISTEMQIGKMKPLIDRAPSGVYVTVGGERAFRGASMFEGISNLIIFDLSPVIISFDKINIELLKAPNKEAYKYLRWEAPFSEWKKISEILTEEDFKWWDAHVRHLKGYDLSETLNRYGTGTLMGNKYRKIRKKLLSLYPFVSKKFNNYQLQFLRHVSWADIKDLPKDKKDPLTKEELDWFEQENSHINFWGDQKHTRTWVQQFNNDPAQAIDWGKVLDYKSGNYLFDEKLYQRLHRLVLERKITLLPIDIRQKTGIDMLVKTIKKLHANLAILELDNLYVYEYMGEEKFRQALSKLLTLGQKDSILILMHNYNSFPGALFSIYLGFTFENVQQWPKNPFLEVFLKTFPFDIVPLLNGRLYEGKDELPLNWSE